MREVVFTERELDVMSVLWDEGSGTVAQVKDGLEDDLAYTTVLTVLRTLEEKGYVHHQEQGRAYRYSPSVERGVARESALKRLTRNLFGGSPELLLSQLVSDRRLSATELRRLRGLLDQRLAEYGK